MTQATAHAATTDKTTQTSIVLTSAFCSRMHSTLKPAPPATHYDILAVKPTASEDEIKQAYLKLAKQCHPDVNSAPDAADTFRRVHDAYNVLSDSSSRKLYDVRLGVQHIPGFADVRTAAGRTASQEHVAEYFRLRREVLRPQRRASVPGALLLLAIPTFFLVRLAFRCRCVIVLPLVFMNHELMRSCHCCAAV